MKKNIKIHNLKNKTFVSTDISEEKLSQLVKMIPKVDTIGMSEEKVRNQQEAIDKIVGDEQNLMNVIAFSNINGMSKQMNAPKYNKEIEIIRNLSANQLKQSFLRLNVDLYKRVNQVQLDEGKQNFYMRKASRFNKESNDYLNMHFAYSFDEGIAFTKEFNDLKELVVKRKEIV